jgi:hypothetical protein
MIYDASARLSSFMFTAKQSKGKIFADKQRKKKRWNDAPLCCVASDA